MQQCRVNKRLYRNTHLAKKRIQISSSNHMEGPPSWSQPQDTLLSSGEKRVKTLLPSTFPEIDLRDDKDSRYESNGVLLIQIRSTLACLLPMRSAHCPATACGQYLKTKDPKQFACRGATLNNLAKPNS